MVCYGKITLRVGVDAGRGGAAGSGAEFKWSLLGTRLRSGITTSNCTRTRSSTTPKLTKPVNMDTLPLFLRDLRTLCLSIFLLITLLRTTFSCPTRRDILADIVILYPWLHRHFPDDVADMLRSTLVKLVSVVTLFSSHVVAQGDITNVPSCAVSLALSPFCSPARLARI